MAFPRYTKDPDDVLDYPINWQAGNKPFLAEGFTIVTSTWTAYICPANPLEDAWVETGEIVIVSDVIDEGETITQVRISGGEPYPAAYLLTNHVVASDGQEKDQTIKIEMKEE